MWTLFESSCFSHGNLNFNKKLPKNTQISWFGSEQLCLSVKPVCLHVTYQKKKQDFRHVWFRFMLFKLKVTPKHPVPSRKTQHSWSMKAAGSRLHQLIFSFCFLSLCRRKCQFGPDCGSTQQSAGAERETRSPAVLLAPKRQAAV